MRVMRGLGVTAVVAGAAVTIAGPAWADAFPAAPIGEEAGSYAVTSGGDSQGTWDITPCGSGCARVASDRGWSAKASLVDGQWSFTRVKDVAVRCKDGSTGAGSIVYHWPAQDDAEKVVGKLTVTSADGACGESQPTSLPSQSFTLTKVG